MCAEAHSHTVCEGYIPFFLVFVYGRTSQGTGDSTCYPSPYTKHRHGTTHAKHKKKVTTVVKSKWCGALRYATWCARVEEVGHRKLHREEPPDQGSLTYFFFFSTCFFFSRLSLCSFLCFGALWLSCVQCADEWWKVGRDKESKGGHDEDSCAKRLSHLSRKYIPPRIHK